MALRNLLRYKIALGTSIALLSLRLLLFITIIITIIMTDIVDGKNKKIFPPSTIGTNNNYIV